MTTYSDSISGDFHHRLRKELTRIFDTILTDNKDKINALKEIKTIAGWYQESGEQPDKIPSTIINKSIERLLEYVEPYLADHLIDRINVKIRPDLDGLEVIEINPPPIEPYIEYIKKINQVESDGIKVTFSVVLSMKLEDIRFRNLQNRQIEVYVDRLIADLTVSIIEISVSIFHIPTVSFSGSIALCNNQLFKAENLSFHLPMR
jgi:hypothetical protein